MGTFHDTPDPLHGITVAAESGTTVFVGRCHSRENGQIVLLDVDQHTEGEDERTNREYLDRAAKFGVWKKHERLVLSAAEVSRITPLAEYFRRPGAPAPTPVPALVAAPAATPEVPVVSSEVPPEPAPATEQPVSLTTAAVAEVQRLLEAEPKPGLGLRLAVTGGGCSGMVYKVEFDARQDGDIVVPCDGFEVLMDRKSMIYLRGVILDHQQGLAGRGFQFKNPNASNTCGCGESFSV